MIAKLIKPEIEELIERKSWREIKEIINDVPAVDVNELSSLAISLSLMALIIFGNILGSMLPFLLTKMGFDPAVTSAPFVSTISDVTGILIYFSIAIAILNEIIF